MPRNLATLPQRTASDVQAEIQAIMRHDRADILHAMRTLATRLANMSDAHHPIQRDDAYRLSQAILAVCGRWER